MREEKRFFGKVNKDIDPSFLADGDCTDAMNLVNISGTNENQGARTIIKGNEEVVGWTLPVGRSKTLKHVDDTVNNYRYLFIYNSNGNHGIYRWNKSSNSVELILMYDFNWDEYPDNFDADYVDGMLYFNDGKNEPRKINIDRAYNYTHGVSVPDIEKYLVINDDIIKAIKTPPLLAPEVSYETDTSFKKNFLRGKLWQFMYEYIYLDYEKSVCSPISSTPLPQGEEYIDGSFTNDISRNNTINITFNHGSPDVLRVKVYARESNIESEVESTFGSWFLIDTVDRYDDNGSLVFSNTTLFKNNKAIVREDNDELMRAFDFLPELAGSQSLLMDNRMVYADIIEGRDNVDIDVALTKGVIIDANWLGAKTSVTVIKEWLGSSWYRFKIDLSQYATIEQGMIIVIWENDSVLTEQRGVFTWTNYDIDTVGDSIYKMFYDYGVTMGYIINGVPTYLVPYYSSQFGWVTLQFTQNFPGLNNFKLKYEIYRITDRYKTFHEGSYQKFGLVYKDASGRNGAVNISEDTEIFLPSFSNYLTNGSISNRYRYKISWKINHAAPSDAAAYQWVYARKKPRILQYVINGFSNTTPDIEVNASKTYIYLNRRIFETNVLLTGSQVPLYEYKKGDWLRIVGYGGTEFVCPIDSHDWIITGSEYEEADSSYKKDDAATPDYIYDNDGNKVYNPAQERIVVQNMTITDSGALNANWLLIEVYSPQKEQDEDIYYSIGEEYSITNGVHSVTSGTFDTGDVIKRLRYTKDVVIPIESTDYSDFYQSDNIDIGRANIVIPDMKRERYESVGRFSRQKIQDTFINGLSSFAYDDKFVLSEQYGSITKLDSVGDILKVKQQLKCTSFYIGKKYLTNADGDNMPVETVDRVLGAKHVSQQEYGCLHPYTVASNGTHEYFFDVKNGVVVRGASNGFFPISKYGLGVYFKEIAKLIRENPNDYYCRGTYDTEDNVYLLGIYKKDMTFGETWVFSEDVKGFCCRVDLSYNNLIATTLIYPEYLAPDSSHLLGAIWHHHKGAIPANFYGQQKDVWIEFVCNQHPEYDKEFLAVDISSTHEMYSPNVTTPVNEQYPLGQLSKIPRVKRVNNKYIGAILRDMNDPKFSGNLALVNGRSMLNRYAKIKLQTREAPSSFVLFGVGVEFQIINK